jgi:hypothetical protein
MHPVRCVTHHAAHCVMGRVVGGTLACMRLQVKKLTQSSCQDLVRAFSPVSPDRAVLTH